TKPKATPAATHQPILPLRERTIETTAISIFEIRNIFDPVVRAKEPKFDQQVVGDAIFKFGLVLQGCVGPRAFCKPSLQVVFNFFLAPSLGIGPFVEPEDLARVDPLLPSLACLSALRGAQFCSAEARARHPHPLHRLNLCAVAAYACAPGYSLRRSATDAREFRRPLRPPLLLLLSRGAVSQRAPGSRSHPPDRWLF